MAGGSARKGSRGDAGEDDDDREDRIDILPPHTGEHAYFVYLCTFCCCPAQADDHRVPTIILQAFNEVAAEIGGCYSSLERCLLLAGMQGAFIQASCPDDSTFARVAAGSSNSDRGAGSRAVHTNLVEECLFAARRSTPGVRDRPHRHGLGRRERLRRRPRPGTARGPGPPSQGRSGPRPARGGTPARLGGTGSGRAEPRREGTEGRATGRVDPDEPPGRRRPRYR